MGFYRYCTKSIYQFGGALPFHNKSFPIHEHGMSFHLLIYIFRVFYVGKWFKIFPCIYNAVYECKEMLICECKDKISCGNTTYGRALLIFWDMCVSKILSMCSHIGPILRSEVTSKWYFYNMIYYLTKIMNISVYQQLHTYTIIVNSCSIFHVTVPPYFF